MRSLEDSIAEWAIQNRNGAPENRAKDFLLWDNYYSYIAKQRKNGPPSTSAAATHLAEKMMAEGILRKGFRVLDIGSGMGDYALAMAEKGCDVTALDMNKDCLELTEARANALALNSLHCECSSWESYDSDTKYDLVFSSLCPAICNVDELKRMESLSAEYCCLIAIMRGSYDFHRKAMMQEFHIQPQSGMNTEALQYYEVLYLMDRKPNVFTVNYHSKYKIPTEKIMEQYKIYFKVFGMDEDTSEKNISAYLANHAEAGFLEEESNINLAMIYWRV